MLLCEHRGGVVWITLDAPLQKNKLSIALLEQLRGALQAARTTRGLRALAVVSAAPDIFAAGADMRELLKLTPDTAVDYAALGQSVMDALATFPVPSYALVAGPCFGGGFDLAMACQRRWATHDAVFCHPGAFLGIVTGFGGTVRLPTLVPPRCARQMLLTGHRLKGIDAFRLGLADRCFRDHGAMIAAFRHAAGEP